MAWGTWHTSQRLHVCAFDPACGVSGHSTHTHTHTHTLQLRRPLPDTVGCLSLNQVLYSRVGAWLAPRPYYTQTGLARVTSAIARPFRALAWKAIKSSLGGDEGVHGNDPEVRSPHVCVF